MRDKENKFSAAGAYSLVHDRRKKHRLTPDRAKPRRYTRPWRGPPLAPHSSTFFSTSGSGSSGGA